MNSVLHNKVHQPLFANETSRIVSVFSDASFDGKLKVAGWGGWAKSDRGTEVSGGPFNKYVPTVGDAEYMAMVNTIWMAANTKILWEGTRVIAQTDNMTVVTMITRFVEGEGHCSFDTGPLQELIDKIGFTLEVRHVKGHVKGAARAKRHHVNNRVDGIAKEGLREARKMHKQGKIKYE